MADQERRSGNIELLESLKEFKHDIKEDIKEIKDELKQFDAKIKAQIDINNKFYHNGFTADKHVADHHIIDGVVEKINENKKSVRHLIDEILKYAAIAIVSWFVATSWNVFRSEVQAPFDNKPKVEQNAKNTPSHP